MREIDHLRGRIEALERQLNLALQHLAVMHAREEVNDCMLSSLILTHPARAALRKEWKTEAASVLPKLLARGSTAWDFELAATAKSRAEYLDELMDEDLDG
ncbi:MAG TPA: hypothetical protein VM619_16240 [Luteimonas sp.]|nr:hypothetical protein [Luteimonas sp.]